WTICPSCGTQFGYDDLAPDDISIETVWADLRAQWIHSGPEWFDPQIPRPSDWDPFKQVTRLDATLRKSTARTTAETDIDFSTVPILTAEHIPLNVFEERAA